MRIPLKKLIANGTSILKRSLKHAQGKSKRSLENNGDEQNNYSIMDESDLIFTSTDDQIIFANSRLKPNLGLRNHLKMNTSSSSGATTSFLNSTTLDASNGYSLFGKKLSFFVIPVSLTLFALLLISLVLLCIFHRRRTARRRPHGRINLNPGNIEPNHTAAAVAPESERQHNDDGNKQGGNSTLPSSSKDIQPDNQQNGGNGENGEANAGDDAEQQLTLKDGLGVLVTQLRRRFDAVNEYVVEEMESKFDVDLDDKIMQMKTFRPLTFPRPGKWGLSGGRMTKSDMMRLELGKDPRKNVSIQDGLKILRQKQLQLQKRQTQITYV